MRRGDVVIVEFPYADGGRGKNRPALVVQNDRDNLRLTNSVVAMISGSLRHSGEPSQLVIDPKTPEGRTSGLHGPSVVKCNNLYTIRQIDVQRTIGRLSNDLLDQVDQALKVALGLM